MDPDWFDARVEEAYWRGWKEACDDIRNMLDDFLHAPSAIVDEALEIIEYVRELANK